MRNVTLCVLVVCGSLCLLSPVTAGTKHYDLPELLGEYTFDGVVSASSQRQVVVLESIPYLSLDRARLVVEGTVVPGRAHGDGVIRENSSFELPPIVISTPSFADVVYLAPEPLSGDFRIEHRYPEELLANSPLLTTYNSSTSSFSRFPDYPGGLIPLPNPDGPTYPLPKVTVGVSVSYSRFDAAYPPFLEPAEPGTIRFADEGVIIDEPVMASITNAYLILEGPGIVPEPTSAALAGIGLLGMMCARRRFHARGPCGSEELTSYKYVVSGTEQVRE